MSSNNADKLPIIEALPGEKTFRIISRALMARENSPTDILLRIQVLGQDKEVLITAQSTRASIAQALQN